MKRLEPIPSEESAQQAARQIRQAIVAGTYKGAKTSGASVNLH